MTDTNQLPPLPEPEGVIVVGTQALRGFTADQMRAYALQARAQVQGELEPYDAGLLNDFGGGNVEWWQDYIRAELGRAHDFYQSQLAPPQPAKATQTDVTDEFLYELWEQKYRSWIGGEQFEQIARAILALRPERVPMTPASRDVVMATRTANADAEEWPEPWAYQRGWNNAEAHHGITAQAKKEDA